MDTENYEIAVNNTSSFGRKCTTIQAAIWNQNGWIRYSGEDADAYHVVEVCTDSILDDSRLARAVTIDTLLDELEIDRVDFLKMDVEGAEAKLLESPKACIRRINTMKIEIHPPAALYYCRTILESFGFACREDERHHACLIAVSQELSSQQ